MDIQVENVTNLYSFSVVVSFDPTRLQVRDADTRTNDIEIALGEFLDPNNHFVLLNQVDHETGTIELLVTQTHPAEAKSGSGVLGTITFESIAEEGSSSIQLTEVQLVDDSTPNPQTIPAGTQDSQVTIGQPTVQHQLYLPLIIK